MPLAAEPRAGSRPFAIVVFALAIAIMGNNAPSPIYPVFQQRLGFSTGALTLVFAVVVAGVVPSLLLLGPLSDTAGRRPLLALALVLALAGALAFCLATSLAGLLVARVLQGLAFGALSGTAVAALAELEPHGDHARATLIATVTIVASQAVGPLASGLLAQYAPDPARLSFELLAGLLLIAVVALAFVPETVARADGPADRPRGRLSVPAAIRGTFAVAALAVAAAFGALGLVAALGPKFVSALLDVHNRAVGGAVVAAMLGASAAAQLGTRRWPARRQLVGGAGALVAGLLAILVGVAAGSLAVFAMGIVVAGAGQGAAYLGAEELLDAVTPADQRGATMSALFLVLYLAASAAALAVGLLSGPLGLRTATVAMAAVLAGLAAVAGLSARGQRAA